VEELQLVLFHPLAVHSLYEQEPDQEGDYYDASYSTKAKNFALRSPFPTFHFLRTKDIVTAIAGGYPQPELIPERNAARLQVLHEKHLDKGGVWSAWKSAIFSG
jgi:hypothetical protein